MLATLKEVLPRAKREHYAVGLFNTVNLEMAKGVLAAAEELGSPVIIGSAEILLPYASLKELASFLLPMAEEATVPVVLHFDHGLTLEKVHEAMDLGFRSVMYDCSTLDFEGNCRAVAELVKEAHARGVTVEAELGHVGANAGGGDDSVFTQPQEAMEFCRRTGVDALAVAIGTAHGAYRSTPKLDIPRLREIAQAVETPLVLHGGSGLSVQNFQDCIQAGIAKVNIFTDLDVAAAKAVHDGWQPGMGMTSLMGPQAQAVKAVVLEKMGIFGSAGKAR